MRVVIDGSIDPRLVEAFQGHRARTLFELGWQHLKDHVPVKQLECDVFITADRGFGHEHDLKSLSFGIVIVHAARNKIAFYPPLFPQLSKSGDDNQGRRRRSCLRPYSGIAYPETKAFSDAAGFLRLKLPCCAKPTGPIVLVDHLVIPVCKHSAKPSLGVANHYPQSPEKT
jgi:hypothetical protein